jgi:hypothetical protein
MFRRVILGTILGALAAFAWAYVSWSAVRLYDWAVQPLPAANELAPQIARAVPRDGAYAFPALDMDAVRAMPDAERAAAVTAWRQESERGPVGLVLVREHGRDPISAQRYLTAFGYMAFSAFLMSTLMAGMRCPSWAGRWVIGIVIALFAAMAANGPGLAWFQLPARWVYAGIADTFLTWTVATAVIAAVVRPKQP